jgi:magnesium transporter
LEPISISKSSAKWG